MKTKILLLLCLLGAAFLSDIHAQSTNDPAEAMRQRITAKVERVKEGVKTWAASGRDPSAIVKALQGTIKPLLDAGKANEAEAELDRVLEQLKQDAKGSRRRPVRTESRNLLAIRTEPIRRSFQCLDFQARWQRAATDPERSATADDSHPRFAGSEVDRVHNLP